MDYKVNVKQVAENEGSNLKAYVNIVFENSFKVTGVKVFEGKNGLFVTMPNYDTHKVDKDGRPIYKNFCNPITKEFYENLNENILQCYQDNLADHSTYERNCTFGDEGLKVTANIIPYIQEGRDIQGIGGFTINDAFAVNRVVIHERVYLNGGSALWASMPSEKKGDVYQDVCYPVTKDFRNALNQEILSSYEKAQEKSMDTPDRSTEKEKSATYRPPKQEHKKSR